MADITAISDKTWELINRFFLGYAGEEKIERGRKVRIDCAGVESNIHDPTDSSLLCDGVRVLTRLIKRLKKNSGIKVPGFANHNRRARRRAMTILNAKGQKRKDAYVDLLKVAGIVMEYARAAIRPG